MKKGEVEQKWILPYSGQQAGIFCLALGLKILWQKGFYQQDLLQSVNTYSAGVFKGNATIKPSLENVVQNNLMCTDMI